MVALSIRALTCSINSVNIVSSKIFMAKKMFSLKYSYHVLGPWDAASDISDVYIYISGTSVIYMHISRLNIYVYTYISAISVILMYIYICI